MTERDGGPAKPRRCTVCDGRGYIHCECWPGDCICGYGDENCEFCEGTGYFHECEDDAFDVAAREDTP